MKKEKTILYYCTSVYQILIVTIMKEIYFQDHNNVVMLEKNLCDKICLDAFESYVDEVIVLNEMVSEYEIDKRLEQILSEYSVDVFGIFTWGVQGKAIYDRIPQEIPIILLDEGVSTCEYKKFMGCAVGEIDFSRISRIWMIDPKISQNDKSVSEDRIAVEEILSDKKQFKKWLDTVNRIFGYEYRGLKEDILFFDRYLVQNNRIPIRYERFVLESMIDLADGMGICIKTHPSEEKGLAGWRYRNLPVTFYEESFVPWELAVLNYMYQVCNGEGGTDFPKVLITTNTTTLFVTQSLLQTIGIEIPIIYINKMIHRYLREVEIIAEKTIEAYQEIYKERKVFLPENWKEFGEALELSVPGFEYDCNKLTDIYRKEYQLLSDEYRKTLRVQGNLLQRVRLEASVKEKEEISCYSYIIAGESEYTVLFDDFHMKEADSVTIKFFPMETPIVYSDLLLRKITYYSKNEKTEIYIEKNYTLTNKVPYVSYKIQTNGEEIESLEIIFAVEREYHVLAEAREAGRNRDYFSVMTKWVDLLQHGNCFQEFCRKKNYKTVGIYGNSQMGRLLETQLRTCGVATTIIDRRELAGSIGIPEALECWDSFELVVVTVLFDYYHIHKTFGFSEKVIGLDDFLDDIKSTI